MKMKLLVLFFLIILTKTYSQTLRGFFIKQSIAGIGDDTKLSEKAKAPVFYEYLFSNNKSSQTLIDGKGTSIDTIHKKHEKYDIVLESTLKTILTSKYVLVKDFKNHTFEKKFTIDNKETYSSGKISDFDWKITNETKIIDGFLCKKATTNMKTNGGTLAVVAWFCEDIPVNDGPLTIDGLPGFIFEATSGDLFSLKFKNFSFNEKENVNIESIKNIEKTQKP